MKITLTIMVFLNSLSCHAYLAPFIHFNWGRIEGLLSSQLDLQAALDTKLTKSSNLSDLTSVSTARTNLGLGNSGVVAGTYKRPIQTVVDSLGRISSVQDFSPSKNLVLVEEFIFPGTAADDIGELGWNVTKSGAGSTVTKGGYADVFNRAMGVVSLETGTATNGRTCISGAINVIGAGYSAIYNEWRFNLATLPSIAEDFALVFGYGDNFVAGSSNINGIDFLIDRTTSFLQTRTTAAGVTTIATSSQVIAAGTWYRASITVNSAGNQVLFGINGVNIATHSTNIIGFAQEPSPYIKIVKSAGTTNRSVLLDYWYQTMDWSSVR